MKEKALFKGTEQMRQGLEFGELLKFPQHPKSQSDHILLSEPATAPDNYTVIHFEMEPNFFLRHTVSEHHIFALFCFKRMSTK